MALHLAKHSHIAFELDDLLGQIIDIFHLDTGFNQKAGDLRPQGGKDRR
jgi:hypothetical protein